MEYHKARIASGDIHHRHKHIHCKGREYFIYLGVRQDNGLRHLFGDTDGDKAHIPYSDHQYLPDPYHYAS